jgi:hypothetical protein
MDRPGWAPDEIDLTRASAARVYDFFKLVKPGLVFIPQWRPDNPDDVVVRPERIGAFAGVGRKE